MYVDSNQVNEVNSDMHGVVDGVSYCKFGAWTVLPKVPVEEVEEKQVVCHSEYPRELIGNCKFGTWRHGTMWCKCTKGCAECTVGGSGDRGGIPMRPELYAARQEERRGMSLSKEHRGLVKVLSDKQEVWKARGGKRGQI